ncbi:MAG: HU family DNA-binding protein [Ignavibacteria bacterium]|jgi:nucleoid DNA-binding protein
MNTIDLINKVSANNRIATGRAEMIISIILEKIIDKLRKEGEVSIEDFGTFKLEKKEPGSDYLSGYNKEHGISVSFHPEKKFLDVINS